MKRIKAPTFADTICDLRIRKIKSVFVKQMNDIFIWKAISKEIDKHYTKGANAVGELQLMMAYCCLKCVYYKRGMNSVIMK